MSTTNTFILLQSQDLIPRAVEAANSTMSSSSSAEASVKDQIIDSLLMTGGGLLLLLLSCYVCRSRIPEPTSRPPRLPKRKEPMDPEKRKRLIDRSLFTKKIIHCDKNGNLTLGEDDDDDDYIPDEENQVGCTAEQDPVDDSNACVVCFEPFLVNDRVSWSKQNQECCHVWHTECIMEWVMTHDDCPSCRCELVNSDDASTDGDKEEDEDLDKDEQEEEEIQTASLAFVIMNGLISRVRRAASAPYSSLASSSRSLDKFDDGMFKSQPPPPLELRRTHSEGTNGPRRSGSFLRVALRRVSTGLKYSQVGIGDEPHHRQEEAESVRRRRLSINTYEFDPGGMTLSPMTMRRVRSDISGSSPRPSFPALHLDQTNGICPSAPPALPYGDVPLRRASSLGGRSPSARLSRAFAPHGHTEDCVSDEEDDLRVLESPTPDTQSQHVGWRT